MTTTAQAAVSFKFPKVAKSVREAALMEAAAVAQSELESSLTILKTASFRPRIRIGLPCKVWSAETVRAKGYARRPIADISAYIKRCRPRNNNISLKIR